MNLPKQTGCIKKLELSFLMKTSLSTERGSYAHQKVTKHPAPLFSHHLLKQHCLKSFHFKLLEGGVLGDFPMPFCVTVTSCTQPAPRICFHSGRLQSTNPFVMANVSLLGYFSLNQLCQYFVRHLFCPVFHQNQGLQKLFDLPFSETPL